jgi:ABC-type lipoprotein export system ATPase subunit
LLQQLNEEERLTIVMATHSQEAAQVAHRCLRLRDGRLQPQAQGVSPL